jgi:hypothetical protein
VPISKLANAPLRIDERKRLVDDGAGGLVEQTVKFPVWYEPRPTGKTPMCEALKTAHHWLKVFVEHMPGSYPPLVVNITDGHATDGDPLPCARELQKLGTKDGQLLLFNVHVSAHSANPVEFPATEASLPDDFARLLFRMSSPLPPRLLEAAKAEGFPARAGTRGFVFNADLVSVVRFLDLGTKVQQPVR